MKTIKSFSAAWIMLAALILAGCSGAQIQKTPQTRLVRAIVTSDVAKGASPGAAVPAEEKAVFSVHDSRAVAFVRFENISGAHNLQWDWYSPDNRLYHTSGAHQINKDGQIRDLSVSWHAIAIRGEKAETLPGKWTVKVSLDGKDIAAMSFDIINNAP